MMGFLGLIPNWLKLSLAAVLAAVLISAGAYQLGKQNGYQRAASEQLQEDIKAERERAKDDAKLRGLSDYDFCTLALRRRGLPVDRCDELRGLSSE
ncbi:hypothetical protein AAIB41_13960 [Brucella sp. BE17]|uniref:hypothetical protein n=1 Tax=Brucella sp. BE17 TaxID=3142977 RepID=UPI0031BB4F4D